MKKLHIVPNIELNLKLEKILITEALRTRSSKPAQFELENQILCELLRGLTQKPTTILNEVVAGALKACKASSAGISLLETSEDKEFYRWPAVVGRLSALTNHTTPRETSACELAIESKKVQLMQSPAKHFEYIRNVDAEISELLIVPICDHGAPIGTLWVTAEDGIRKFDSEDSRLLSSLANFAHFAIQTQLKETKAQEAEAKLAFERHQLETLFQHTPAAMVLWAGKDFVFEKVNPSYQAIFPDRVLLGKKFLEACPEFKGQPFQDLLTKVLITGEPFVGREILARHRTLINGPIEDHYYDFTYMRVTDANGNPYGVYDHAIDVTDRVIVRKKLEENQERLKKAIEARDTFLGIASHELKTPLTSLKLQSQANSKLYEKGGMKAFTEEKFQAFIANAVVQSERLSRLVDDMLDVSRITLGKLRMNFETTNISKTVEDTFARFAPQLKSAGSEVAAQIEEGLHAYADPFRFEQVLTNLITNLIKYGSGKPGELTVKASGPKIIIKLRDHGIGIPADQLDRVFERFERLGSAEYVTGLGLGLYISKEIVDAHNGFFSVSSEVGVGSEFSLILPLVRDLQ